MGLNVSTSASIELLRAYDDYSTASSTSSSFGAGARPRRRRRRRGGAVGVLRRGLSSVVATFEYFDRNRSGFLDYRELRNALTYMGLDVSTAAIVDLLRAYDDYPDGKLDVHEFETLVRDLKSASCPAVAGVGYLDAWSGTPRRGCRGRRGSTSRRMGAGSPRRRGGSPEGSTTTGRRPVGARRQQQVYDEEVAARRSTTPRRSTSCGRWVRGPPVVLA